ncbi:MAG TPA: DUF1905 domain-containing protein [Devosiaceae bacterium]|jgi:hypothetical protein|nr:DUF1905 domain-containing protein [Devosiaceae bacterium]
MSATLPVTFTAEILKSPAKGGWTYLIWPASAAFFATRARVRIAGTVDTHPLRTAFMPLGTGHHKLPLTAKTLAAIGKSVGDTVTVVVEQRLE